MNNKNTTYALGAVLIILGLIFIISPSGVFETIVSVGAIIIIGFSILGIVNSVIGKNNSYPYYLGSSILGLIFGIVLFNNADSAIKTIPVILGLWLFISGLSTTIFMSKSGSSLVSMTSPITRVILGLICFISPVIPISIVGIYIGAILILSGINTITNVKNEEVIYKVKVKK